jgi:hypothetical protein
LSEHPCPLQPAQLVLIFFRHSNHCNKRLHIYKPTSEITGKNPQETLSLRRCYDLYRRCGGRFCGMNRDQSRSGSLMTSGAFSTTCGVAPSAASGVAPCSTSAGESGCFAPSRHF